LKEDKMPWSREKWLQEIEWSWANEPVGPFKKRAIRDKKLLKKITKINKKKIR